MNKLVTVMIGLFAVLSSRAQVQLDRQVIGCTGAFGSGSYSLSYTAGQPEFETGSGENASLTQGFQQPGFKDPIVVDVQISHPSCSNDSLGSLVLTEIGGCATENFSVLLNGEPMEFPIQNLSPGNYVLEIQSGFNCSFSGEFELVFSDADCGLNFYNVITANGDGFNDTWVIEGLEQDIYRSNRVQIFSRWGSLVWEGVDYDNETVVWKGLDSDGNPLPEGTYFYSARLGNSDHSGYIELLR